MCGDWINSDISAPFVSARLHCATGTRVKRAGWPWILGVDVSDPTDPDSSLLNLSSESMEVSALVAGAGSRSSSASSTGHRVSHNTFKDSQGKPIDHQGCTRENVGLNESSEEGFR